MPDKERERYYLQSLLTTLGQEGAILGGEHPDFLLLANGERLGVELTVFHLPPANGERPHQEQVALQARAVEQARRRHTAGGGCALYVTVNFRPGHVLSRKSADVLGKELYHCVNGHSLPEHYRQGRLEIPVQTLPEGIVGCSVYGSMDGKDALWYGGHGGCVAPVSPAHVQAVLTRKAGKAVRMRQHCDRLWLVVVQDAFSAAAPCELSLEAAEHSYIHPFDRALWFVPHGPSAVELRRYGATYNAANQ